MKDFFERGERGERKIERGQTEENTRESGKERKRKKEGWCVRYLLPR